MIQRLNFRAPVSVLSLGQVGFNLLRELYRRKVQVAFFPRDLDLRPFKVDQQFGQWIERAVNTRYAKLDRSVPTLSVWHLAGSEESLSDKQFLLSFHETDSPTESELGVLRRQDHTFFTSSWTVDNFKTYGADNVSFVPLGLDEDFVPAKHRLIADDKIHWICVGKHESLRKMTDGKIQAWIKRYGGKRGHELTICVHNPFYQRRQRPDGQVEGFDMNDVYARLFGGADWMRAKPHNVNVLPPLRTNAEMLALYQSADLDISGFSRSEGHNIPAHTVTALGKWSIVTNCSAHKDWATKDNAILVEPTGAIKAQDNFFFRPGEQFSQGNFFDFAPDAFDQALVEAEKRAKTPNPAGEALRQTHTYAKTLDTILAKIGD